jgi:hypothetical protein
MAAPRRNVQLALAESRAGTPLVPLRASQAQYARSMTAPCCSEAATVLHIAASLAPASGVRVRLVLHVSRLSCERTGRRPRTPRRQRGVQQLDCRR